MRFHPLAIARVDRETRDAVAITFAVPPSLADAFRWEAGQHLTLRAEVGGEDLRRSYSICTPPDSGALTIAIKRAPGGLFSNHANAMLKAGDIVDVMAPMGHFMAAPAEKADGAPARYVAFAAGSGITPIVAIVAATLAADRRAEFTLVYGNRASSTVMFRETLAALKDRYLDRFNLVHVLSREAQDIELLHGRIDRAKADALLDHWVSLDGVDAVYLCGPEGMMDAVHEALAARGYPEARIRVERFAASIPRHRHVPRPLPEAGAAETAVDAVIDGSTRSFTLKRGEENIIDAALRQGIELPYSCKGGVCSTCRCKLVDGEVDMDVNYALEDYEVARGYVLACQSYPVTARVVVDFDQ
ncbi:MAG: phenylacetate-CoA oxygenase/reductase subunit PaaK [Proteobacteria bacterium]|nr:phenylacetate-CoA oxygenase/reductase subunit PaaK [Pseudomonadota bacterium]